eukprot:2163916-Amphidinium_carterae.1
MQNALWDLTMRSLAFHWKMKQHDHGYSSISFEVWFCTHVGTVQEKLLSSMSTASKNALYVVLGGVRPTRIH